MLVFHYPKCSTCVKARKWLRDKNVEFTEKNIVEETPSVEELEGFGVFRPSYKEAF